MLCHYNNGLNCTFHWSNVWRRALNAMFHKKNASKSFEMNSLHSSAKMPWFRASIVFLKMFELLKPLKSLSFGFYHMNPYHPWKIINKNYKKLSLPQTWSLWGHKHPNVRSPMVLSLTSWISGILLTLIHASQTNVEVGREILPRVIFLNMFWSAKMLLISKCPSWWCQSSVGLPSQSWLHPLRIFVWRSFDIKFVCVELLQLRCCSYLPQCINLHEIAHSTCSTKIDSLRASWFPTWGHGVHLWCKLWLFCMLFQLQRQWTSFQCGRVIIIQTYIAWKNHLVCVEWRPMWSHVVCGSRIHDPFANVSQMCSILCCKCEFIPLLCVLAFFFIIL